MYMETEGSIMEVLDIGAYLTVIAGLVSLLLGFGVIPKGAPTSGGEE